MREIGTVETFTMQPNGWETILCYPLVHGIDWNRVGLKVKREADSTRWHNRSDKKKKGDFQVLLK